MKEKSNNESNLSKYKDNKIILIGIGIFYWTGFGHFAFLFERILIDVFFNFDVRPNLTIIFGELVFFLTYLIGVIMLIKIIKLGKIDNLKLFKFSFLLIAVAQVLQFFQPSINSKFRVEHYFENSQKYDSFLMDEPIYYYISIVSVVILYLLVGMIIYLKRK